MQVEWPTFPLYFLLLLYTQTHAGGVVHLPSVVSSLAVYSDTCRWSGPPSLSSFFSYCIHRHMQVEWPTSLSSFFLLYTQTHAGGVAHLPSLLSSLTVYTDTCRWSGPPSLSSFFSYCIHRHMQVEWSTFPL